MNLSAMGGRKFLLSMSTLASATALVWLGHIADGVYSAVVIATAGAYIAGNVVQKINSSATTKESK
jgi:hypothetical protein